MYKGCTTDDLLVGLKQVSPEFMSLVQHLLQCIMGFLTVHGQVSFIRGQFINHQSTEQIHVVHR